MEFDAGFMKCEMLNAILRAKLYLPFLPIIYHKHSCMMSVKRAHKEVNTGHLENQTKFKVSDNTSVTPSVQQTMIGNTKTPCEKIQ